MRRRHNVSPFYKKCNNEFKNSKNKTIKFKDAKNKAINPKMNHPTHKFHSLKNAFAADPDQKIRTAKQKIPKNPMMFSLYFNELL